MSAVRPVVLSGGSGTRLWPLSTPDRPKQFTRLTGDRSLFELTLLRLHGRPEVSSPIVVTGRRHTDLVTKALDHTGVGAHRILIEPEGRNTAPACVAAALASDPDDVLVIVPSDHLIAEVEGYASAVEEAAAQAQSGRVVTFGIQPNGPETGFGYIEMAPGDGVARTVARFKEKPGLSEARRLVSNGHHVWNSGMFVLTAATLLEEAGAHCPAILHAVGAAMREPEGLLIHLGPEFLEAEKISFDHAIMERTGRAVVIPIDVGWSDVGSFSALWEASEKDVDGNVVDGDVVTVDVEGSLIRSTSRRVAVAGLHGVVVVETPDGVLVVPRDRSQMVRDLVERQPD